jgi:lysophospholipase L1-like esterase
MMIRIRPSIVLFGDSLTELAFGEEVGSSSVGWASLLASAYSRRADVLNHGFRGYNTDHALGVLLWVFEQQQQSKGSYCNGKTLFCTVFFGANDCTLPGETQHKPIEEFGDNMRTIVRSI